MDGQEKEKFDYKEWYETNKDKIADGRQVRYNNDPAYRAKALARARYYYWTKKRKNTLVEPEKVEEIKLEPNKAIKIDIHNPADARFGQAIDVPVYDTGEIGRLMDRTAQTLRLWERRKVIPKAFWRDVKGFRLYTEDQVIAFLENKHYLSMPAKNIEDSVFAREMHKSWEEMPDGVKVEPSKMYRVTGNCSFCGSPNDLKLRDYEIEHLARCKCGRLLTEFRKVEV